MEVVVVLILTCAIVVAINKQGWYTLSEYIALFGAGWVAGALFRWIVG